MQNASGMKHSIRQNFKDKRAAISPNLRTEKSALIRQKLEALAEFQAAKNLLIYVSKNDEVETHELIKDCLNSGKKVYAPKIENDKLTIYEIADWHQLKPGTFDILEPYTDSIEAHPEKADLILIPGVAFDKYGHRLGYGKGFYDRLLKNTKAHKIGLAFEEQIVEKIPAEEHDVALDLIITDQSIIHP